jgi:hypothetical protein
VLFGWVLQMYVGVRFCSSAPAPCGFLESWPGPFCNGTGANQVSESTFEWAKDNLPFFETSQY